MNRNLLLNIIRREGRLSRTQLTERSGLSVGAVSGIVNDLIKDHWLLEVGEGDYTGGRRQTPLRLNPDAGFAIGLKLMENRIVAAVTDLETSIRQYFDRSYTFTSDPERLADILANTINLTINETAIPQDKLFGVGMGLAGVIYTHTGIVHYSPFFGWRDVPLAHMVAQRIALPVYVENDVNTLTITEQLFGAGQQSSNFVVVTIGRGVGMGIVINGQLYRGNRGGAGELGHVVLSRMNDAQYVCLEDLSADPVVLREVAAADGRAPNDLHDVVTMAKGGHAGARAALARSGEMLGLGLAAVVNMLCPELIVISGEGVEAGDFRLKPMLESMKQHTFDGLMDHLRVVIEPTDDRAWARGAASLVISKAFASPIHEARVDG